MMAFSFMLAARGENPASHMVMKLESLYEQLSDLSSKLGLAYEDQRKRNGYIRELQGDKNELNRDIEALREKLLNNVAENTQEYINGQRDEIKRLIKCREIDADTMAEQAEEIASLKKQLKDALLERYNPRNMIGQTVDSIRLDGKAFGFGGPVGLYGETPQERKDGFLTADAKLDSVSILGFDKNGVASLSLGYTVPRFEHVKEPAHKFNCRCKMIPVQEPVSPKSTVPTVCNITHEVSGVECHWEFSGTPDEVRKAIIELKLVDGWTL